MTKAIFSIKVTGYLFLAALVLMILSFNDSHYAHAQTVPLVAPTQNNQTTLPDIIQPDTPKVDEVIDLNAPIIESITIEGAERIDPATVLNYFGLEAGELYSRSKVNKAVQDLFSTGLFSDIQTNFDDQNKLNVEIVENPVINRIAFEGNEAIDDDILESEINLRPRRVFTRPDVQAAIKRILELYRRKGRYSAKVIPKTIKKEQNRIDLVFEISDGPVTTIDSINFINNGFFSDDDLKDTISSKEDRWYRFLTDTDRYDPDRLSFDKQLLRKHYLQNGFIDFRVVSAVAELKEDLSGFSLTFTLAEGERYTFGQINVKSHIPEIDSQAMLDVVVTEEGEWYDIDSIDDSSLNIIQETGNLGYAFIDVDPQIERNDEQKIADVDFIIKEGQQSYIERIDVVGNVRTVDDVIRREIQLAEGDAFNADILRKSRENIQNLGFFSKVEMNSTQGSTDDRTSLEVDVEEQSTGALSLGVGVSSSDGPLGRVSLSESNLFGEAKHLGVAASISKNRQEYDLSYTQPWIADRPIDGGFDLFHITRDLQSSSSFDQKDTGVTLRADYKVAQYLSQQIRYTYQNTHITNVKTTASSAIQAAAGSNDSSSVAQTLLYDRRNSISDPTDGYYSSLTSDLVGLGGDTRVIRGIVKGAYYYTFLDDYNVVAGSELGHVLRWNNKVIPVNERFFLGGANLRGFKDNGIGPRDTLTRDALGAGSIFTTSAEIRFPTGLPEEFGITGAFFTDAGTLFHPENTSTQFIKTKASLRVASGIGIGWKTPIGPLRFDFAKPLQKESYDRAQFFRFSFATRF